MSVMIRHGRNNKGQRNRTLATVRMGPDMLVFGVARCNLKADRWDKHWGADIAKERMKDIVYEATVNLAEGFDRTEDGFLLKYNENGNLEGGVCHVTQAVDLVSWFRDGQW